MYEMNFTEMMEKQAQLDEFIMLNQGLPGYGVINKCIALSCEVSECLNEWQGFKDWKVSNAPKRLEMIEEYADIMAFAFGIGNALGADKSNITYNVAYNEKHRADVGLCFMILQQSVLTLYAHLLKYVKEENGFIRFRDIVREEKAAVLANFVLIEMVKLAAALGLTPEEIEGAYYCKMNINYDRQKNNY